VARTRTLSVGNDFNDLDLLEWAHSPFVMANAPAELRQRFATVASNDHCGVAEAAERWIERLALSVPAATTNDGGRCFSRRWP
jgi:hydroxymethylpyrimidine pyrophosphatase-like HAD family hydrolase